VITQYFRSITAGATTVLADTHGSDLQVVAGTNITLTADPVLGQLTIGTSPGASFPAPITQDNSTNATNYVIFNNASSGDLTPRTDTDFYYNPATGVLAVSAIRFGDTTIASTASEALAVANFNFNIAGDDSTQRIISLNETVQFVGTGGIGVTTDAEGKVTITMSSTPTITGGTINNAIIGGTTPAAGTFTTLTGGGGSANFIQTTGAATTLAPQFQALGSDTNVSLAIQSKGTGAIDLAAGSSGVNISNGNTVTAITRIAPGSGYTSIPGVVIPAPTTTGGVQATASASAFVATVSVANGGTGYTNGDVLTASGGTGASATFTVTSVSSGVITAITVLNNGSYTAIPTSPASVTGGTGLSATINLLTYGVGSSFTITNAGSGYVEQPTVTFSGGGGGSGAAAYATVGSSSIIRAIGSTGNSALDFQVPSSVGANANAPVLRLRDVSAGSSAGFVMIQNNNGYAQIVAQGATDASLNIASNGAGRINFNTQSTLEVTQLRVTHTASAVNFSQITGATQGTGPTLSVGGTDAINDFNIRPAGVGRTNIRSDLSVNNTYAQGGNNLVVWSQDITNVAWGKTSGLSVGSSITAPDGTATANSLTSSIADAYTFQSAVSNTSVPNGVFTLSMWLKVPSGSFSLPIYLLERTGAFLVQQTCALTTSWQRFSVTKTMDPYTNGCNIQIGGASALSSGRVVHIWGVQLEPGPGVSYYTPTTSSQIIANNIVTASSFRYTNGEVPGYTYQLDDISSRFNGSTVSFPLTYNDGTSISPNNPNKVNITVGNAPVKPARYIRDFFNLPEFAVFTQGYVISGSTITFATPPLRGMRFYGEVRTNQDLAPTFTFKQAPFSALNIMSRS
jgi:hypothetical protein